MIVSHVSGVELKQVEDGPEVQTPRLTTEKMIKNRSSIMKLKLVLALAFVSMTLTACATQPTENADAQRTAKAERIADRMNHQR
jgi:predicted small secreted protein